MAGGLGGWVVGGWWVGWLGWLVGWLVGLAGGWLAGGLSHHCRDGGGLAGGGGVTKLVVDIHGAFATLRSTLTVAPRGWIRLSA